MKIKQLVLVCSISIGVYAIFQVLESSWTSNGSSLRQQKNPKITEEAGVRYKEYPTRIMSDSLEDIPSGLYQMWQDHDDQVSGSRYGTSASMLTNVQEIGPFDVGGRTRALHIDYANSSRYFAGGVSGGLWRSDNAGNSWIPLSDDLAHLSVTCITQNPMNHDEIYYGTGEVEATGKSYLGEGIYKSDDGGSTFEVLPSTLHPDFSQIWSIKHHTQEDSTIYVGTNQGILWKSTDAGASWQEEFDAQAPITDIEILPYGHVYIAVKGQGIYRSAYTPFTGAFGFFVEVQSNLPDPGSDTFQRIEIAFSQNNSNVMYALYADGHSLFGMYRSVTSGFTWDTIPNFPDINVRQTNYNLAVGVDPDDSDNLFIGADIARYSTNGGLSWSPFDGGHADYHSYAVHTGNPDVFLVGNDGGVYRKDWTSLGTPAEDLNNGYNVTQFYRGAFMQSGLNVLGGTQDNGMLRMLDGVWDQILGGDGGFASVSLQNPNLAYVQNFSLHPGTIRRSYDIYSPTAGADLEDLHTALHTMDTFRGLANFETNKTDGEQVFYSSRRRIWRTNDEGDNWDVITYDNSSIINSVAVTREYNPSVYYVGGASNIWRVPSARNAVPGDEYQLTNIPAGLSGHEISSVEIHPYDNSVIFVTYDNGSSLPRLYRIEDANTNSPTWIPLKGNMPSWLPYHTVEIDPDNDERMFIGTLFGVYYTEDGGSNWFKVDEIPNVPILDLKLRTTDRQLFVFTHGRGAWSATVSGGTATSYAELPYSTGFEDGFLDKYWSSFSSDPVGSVQVTDQYGPLLSDRHLVLDNKSNGTYCTNTADLHLNLSKNNNITIGYYWKRMGDEEHPEDGVYISNDGGQNFTKLHNFSSGSNNAWNQVTINEAQLSFWYGINLTAECVLRFQQHDNYGAPADGIAIDNINIDGDATQTNYASLPYSTGFEEGFADEYWELISQPNGRNRVISIFEPETGDYHLTMDVEIDRVGSPVNESWLRLDLSGESDVTLEFSWKETSDEPNIEDGLFISDDAGLTFIKLYDFGGGTPNVWNNVSLNLSDYINWIGLSHSSTFVLKFQQRDNAAMPYDGIAIDNINITVPIDDVIEPGENPLDLPDLNKGSIAIYPVPAQDEVTISLEGDFDGMFSGEILTLDGKLVKQLTVRSGSNRLNVSDLSQGTYLVVISDGENQIVQKLIKQ